MKERPIDTHDMGMYGSFLSLIDREPGPSVKQEFREKIHLCEHNFSGYGQVILKNGCFDSSVGRLSGRISDFYTWAIEDVDD